MPVLYRVITAIIAFTGCISLYIYGEIFPVVSLSSVILIPGYYRFIIGKNSAPRSIIGVFSIFILIFFLLDSAVISGDVLLAVAHLTILFQILKSFDLKGPWDPLQVFFMSLLQLIIASDFTQSIIFGVIIVLYLALLVTAMVLSHFIKEGSLGTVSIKKPLIAISVLMIFFTAGFFVSIPRIEKRFFGKSHHVRGIKTVGFSETVDFGSFGNVKLDPTVVMRIQTNKNIAPPYYWRGMALDYFDGISWTSTLDRTYLWNKIEDIFVISDFDQESSVEQKIYLEPIDSNIIFGLAKVSAIKARRTFLQSDSSMAFFLRGTRSQRVNYTVYSNPGEAYMGQYSKKYLQLPPGMDRIIGFAREKTSTQETGAQKASVIEQYLKNNFAYSLNTYPPPRGVTPIEDFLFNTKLGFCEHYATSMVIMLRSVGIQSRIVNGFYGGEKNMYSDYLIVKQSDAHSWVEAIIDGKWKRYDPTPSVQSTPHSVLALLMDSLKLNWNRYVVGFNIYDQKSIVRGAVSHFSISQLLKLKLHNIRYILYLLIVITVLFSLIYTVLSGQKRQKTGYVTRKYLDFRNMVKKRGIKISPSMTAGEIRSRLVSLQKSDAVNDFLAMYEEHRFGGKKLGRGDRMLFHNLISKIKKQFRNYRR